MKLIIFLKRKDSKRYKTRGIELEKSLTDT